MNTLFFVAVMIFCISCYQEKSLSKSETIYSSLNVATNDLYRDTAIENISYYGNGRVQLKTITFYEKTSIPYKTSYLGYRKNGARKFVCVTNDAGLIDYSARYNKQNELVLEKIYTYNFKYVLVQIETIKNGISRIQTFDTDINGDPVCD
ncbi:MAG: hypothetical protein ACRC3B_22310 [Bacteroidia bacterium]